MACDDGFEGGDDGGVEGEGGGGGGGECEGGSGGGGGDGVSDMGLMLGVGGWGLGVVPERGRVL